MGSPPKDSVVNGRSLSIRIVAQVGYCFRRHNAVLLPLASRGAIKMSLEYSWENLFKAVGAFSGRSGVRLADRAEVGPTV
jgi:hypothetical protein